MFTAPPPLPPLVQVKECLSGFLNLNNKPRNWDKHYFAKKEKNILAF